MSKDRAIVVSPGCLNISTKEGKSVALMNEQGFWVKQGVDKQVQAATMITATAEVVKDIVYTSIISSDEIRGDMKIVKKEDAVKIKVPCYPVSDAFF